MSRYLSFHQGELAVQAMANESAIAQRNGRVVSNEILPGAIPFIAQQNMLVVSSIDDTGRPWSSVLFGTQGFIQANTSGSLILDLTKMQVNDNDPLWQNIAHNKQVGVLAIELSTRRRFRVNGRIEPISKGAFDGPLQGQQFEITVQQAYPNCPKFIQRRNLKIDESIFTETLPAPVTGFDLTPEHLQIIEQADSFFVSSCSLLKTNESNAQEHSLDASHRGGLPGFIKVLENNTLLIPDYQGNSMFNTLGNIHLYAKAGIIIVDFDNARVLQLSGSAEILWDKEDETNHSSGTKRFWKLSVEIWQETKIPKGINWHFQDYSPHNPRERKLKEASLIGKNPNEKMSLSIQQVKGKSPRINQYRLVAQDGALLPAFDAGAHLPIEVTLDNGKTVLRHYSILSSPHDNRFYDIAVQQEVQGRGGSKAIHNNLVLGSKIHAFPPKNAFPLMQDDKHKILIAGGIGITPILAMLGELSDANASFEIHYSAKSEADLAYKDEVLKLAGAGAFFYTSKAGQEREANRLDLTELIENSKADSHVYMCGPLGMILQVRELAQNKGWSESRIHFESFGAASLPDDKPIEVRLKKSNQVIIVDPKQSILDALSDNDVSVPFDCKRGECGLCATRIVAGEAEHRDVYLTKAEQKNQMCICVSRAKGDSLTLDL